MKRTSPSPAQTRRLGADFARRLVPSLKARPVIVGLFGDLGSGKTTFVQGMARGCGIDPDHYVNSPTFTMVNEYEGKDLKVVHVDLYRIDKPLEGTTLALEDYLRPGHLLVIEWPERWPGLIGELDFQIRFEGISDRLRTIDIAGAGRKP